MTHSPTAINPHAPQPTSLIALISSMWRNRQFFVQMTNHGVVGCYKGLTCFFNLNQALIQEAD